MDLQLRTKWVEALRSGDYEQSHNMLRKTYSDGSYGFCCLGVLCDVIDPDGWKQEDHYSLFNFKEGSKSEYWVSATTLHESAAKRFNLDKICTFEVWQDGFNFDVKKRIDQALMDMNDMYEWTFGQIADWIEENIPTEEN